MGFGKMLGGIGKGLLGLIPGGGTITSILDMAEGLAAPLGKAAGGRAEGQQAGFNNELAAANVNAGAPAQRMSNMSRAMLAGAPPAKFNWGGPGSVARGEGMPSFSGGSRHRDPRMSQLASSIMDQEINNQMTGDDLVSPPKSGMVDKALGAGAFGSSILGGIGAILNKRKAGGANPLGIKGY